MDSLQVKCVDMLNRKSKQTLKIASECKVTLNGRTVERAKKRVCIKSNIIPI
jgi:hypothetical protein